MMKEEIMDCRRARGVIILLLITLLSGCGGGGGGGESDTDNSSEDSPEDTSGGIGDGSSDDSITLARPEQMIVQTLSATSVEVSWQPSANVTADTMYRIYRDGVLVASDTDTQFTDIDLIAGQQYSYTVTSFDGENESEASNSDVAKTLINDDNDGLSNGAVITLTNISLRDICGTGSIAAVSVESLDGCLNTAVEAFNLRPGLEDMRAFVARLRREEQPALIDLGMRLFHSKSLSQNTDVACSSCHHPSLGCGGDDLSLAIGVNAENPDVLGEGRRDGNALPLVPRHSQQICNTGLWSFALFWDDRVKYSDDEVFDSDIRTDERDVTNITNDSEAKSLLMAQAHFPVTAAAEMGDPSGFDSPQDYREFIADRLDDGWKPAFNKAYGSEDVNFTLLSEALAAYEKSQLFIENPFFEYLDGNLDSLNEDEKRGALFFYTNGGCSNCHDGVFFSPEKTRPPAYPQIGRGTTDDGSDLDTYRVPSLLNVALTGPYGHAGQFETLERVIQHYSNSIQSIDDYFSNNEVCNLQQFAALGSECAETIAENGLSNSLAVVDRNQGEGNAPPLLDFDDEEIAYLVAFLHTLTDESARAGSNEIKVLIPPRDGGPDGNQLDAIDKDGNPL
ncbi:MAG: hypothetical protein JKY54_19045 [Flavobacteriales bacterium]|nr:hypothetical protein [Flavobacteriales bacterium]